MKCLLLVCWDAERMDAQTEPDPDEPPNEESFPWVGRRANPGQVGHGRPAGPAAARARSVRVRDGKPLITDGPFAETKEAIGGFDVLECSSLEEAVEIEAAHPIAQTGAIEVRPVWGN